MKLINKIQILSVICVIFTFQTLIAQENTSSVDFGGDLVSRYVWRGMNLSNSPAIQPYIEYSKGNFALGTWASYTFSKEPFQELDLYLSYNIGVVTLGLNDYFVTIDSLDYVNNYSDWNQSTTGHALEGVLTISDIPNIPLSLTAGVMLYGADIDDSGDNLYSTYIELGYDFSVGDIEANSFVGITPSNGLYSDAFNVVNVGVTFSKEVSISEELSLPVSSSFIINPDMGNSYLVFAFSF